MCRIPPTEKRGRVHTSRVTVCILDASIINSSPTIHLNDKELAIEWFSGTGKGGQRRNKVKTSCRLTHKLTGIIKSAQTRKRSTSFDQAKRDILVELELQRAINLTQQINKVKRGQIGDECIRVYNYCTKVVTNQTTGSTIRVKEFKKGRIHQLWS